MALDKPDEVINATDAQMKTANSNVIGENVKLSHG